MEVRVGGTPQQHEEMVRENLPRLLRLCTVILGSHQEAEDAVQDVFLQALRSFHRFRGASRLSTWLTSIAVHLCRDRIRARKRRREVPEDHWAGVETDPRPSPLDRMMARQLARRAVAFLSPKEEMVVRLRFGGDCRMQEIARTMGCSESAAKTHLRRALAKMARALEGEAS
jgi:RNA polymerase sigma-70 factor (ECF subfamily)